MQREEFAQRERRAPHKFPGKELIMTNPIYADLLRSTGGDKTAAALLMLAHEIKSLAAAIRSNVGTASAPPRKRREAHAVRATAGGGSKV